MIFRQQNGHANISDKQGSRRSRKQIIQLFVELRALNFNTPQVVARGIGRGSFDRVVASDTRGPWFDSSHCQLLLNIYLQLSVYRKD